jgi:glycosyltransferase involved in cell wall biosynthesis
MRDWRRATVLPWPERVDDLVIRIANTPIFPFPYAHGSAAWEKANLHKALGIALALAGTGARVIYYGTANSDIAGYAPGVPLEVVPLLPGGIAEHPEWAARHREDAFYGEFYDAVVQEGAHVVIVGGDAQSFREVPALSRLLPNTRFFCNNHGLGPHPDAIRAYERCNGIVDFVAISRAQLREYPTLRHVGVVYNALHPDEFQFQPEPVDYTYARDGVTRTIPAGYLILVGRMNREKGPHHAIAIARRAGMRLLLAGPVAPRPWDPDFFAREVAPEIDDDQIIYLGELGPAELDRLYKGALAMIFPIEWEEPFGFAVAEAMARGVPVVATPRGAMPELIWPGVNGFLVESEDEAVARIKDIASISRQATFASVFSRFTWEATGREYVELIWRAFASKSGDTRSG